VIVFDNKFLMMMDFSGLAQDSMHFPFTVFAAMLLSPLPHRIGLPKLKYNRQCK